MQSLTINKCIHTIFSEQAQLSPDNIAIVAGNDCLTYYELDTISDNLALQLMYAGVKLGTSIAIFTERSPQALQSMLATLKVGGVYVPVDISYPADRISFILKDCNPAVVLTTHADAAYLPETTVPLIFLDEILELKYRPAENLLPDVSPEEPAYIIYTSGTTGIPKGVVVAHRGVVRLVFDQDYIEFGPKKTILQLASLAFDAATFEVWAPLLHGGKCVLYPKDNIPDTGILQRLISEQKITTIWLTTTLFNTIITTNPGCLKGVSEILVGGEALSPSHIRKAFKELPRIKIINGYGPTENTTFTTCYAIPRDLPVEWRSIPIGKVLNHSIYQIYDKQLEPVPPGEIGELCVGGAGLALGYLNRPDLTAEKFIDNPDPKISDQKLYRTGDFVRHLSDGNLDYIGRIDGQIKIRGFRVELGEISSALLEHPNVKEAVVILHTNDRKAKQLIAYIVFQGSQTLTKDLHSFLAGFLPEYMLPASFISVDSIPLNSNGKLDKNKLPQPSFISRNDYIAPGSKMEKKLTAIWSGLLCMEQISIVDNFFDIGGTSLLGIELFDIINNTFNLEEEIEAVTLYEFSTIQALARHLSLREPGSTTDVSGKKRASRQKSAFGKFKKIRRL